MRVWRQQKLLGAFVVSALLLSGCSVGSAESASPAAATPAAESAAPAASAAAVETAGDYKIGDAGPGGGIVFYDAGSVQPWGRYLEAAPAKWFRGDDPSDLYCDEFEEAVELTVEEAIEAGVAGAGEKSDLLNHCSRFVFEGDDPKQQWCGGPELNNWNWDVAGTKESIGAGAANTELIAVACGAGAANTARAYDGGGKTDWFLPSKDELNALHKQRDILGGFGADNYWSSSQYDAVNAWNQYFPDGNQYNYNEFTGRENPPAYGVRPVRAF